MFEANAARKLQSALTVGQLRRMLRDLEEDSPVVFVCNYGDYCNTQQALPVGDLEEAEFGDIVSSAYSQSGLALQKCETELDREIRVSANDGDDTNDNGEMPPVVVLRFNE